ncbi:hypothetical protein LSTR_LSTR012235 [Laodelphax striatellus]|uniref:Uncharacterized protein n=1 Tax=Laodelphax striatellus TaxID=195883 RepID=A0A482WSN5_LAOST|nr:hypothetical protein LSTR_LSTR012235 [Laodelphax striatellus]
MMKMTTLCFALLLVITISDFVRSTAIGNNVQDANQVTPGTNTVNGVTNNISNASSITAAFQRYIELVKNYFRQLWSGYKISCLSRKPTLSVTVPSVASGANQDASKNNAVINY